MTTQRFVQAALLILGAVCVTAQPSSAPASSVVSTQGAAPVVTSRSSGDPIVSQSLLLSNKAVTLVSGLRGIDAHAIKLKFGNPMSGRFEIPVEGTKDLRREAELLSKDFGTNVAVIVDEATADGLLRTNYVFRNGSMRQTVAPVGRIGLPPGGRRMYVWPETSKIAAPRAVRIVQ